MYNKWIFPDSWQVLVVALYSVLHQRSAWRLSVIIAGIIFANGRKTITSWFRAAGINQRYKAFYYFIGSIGQETETIATVLFEFMINLIYRKDNRVLMGIDDSPTKRYGPKVQGAGIHRNPTVRPDGAKFIYGHLWVTLSVLVLIVREACPRAKRRDKNCWRAFMCTNLSATAQQNLEAVADRFAIEQNFHDLKEIEGAGQQQVRSYSTNVGVFHLNMWVHTMIELWAWNKPASVICDRSSSPWDNFSRRPSHADRCCGLRRGVLKGTFSEIFGHDRKTRKIARQFYKLMKLTA